MTTLDHRTRGEEAAETSWYAYRAKQGEALDNVSQKDLYVHAFGRGAAWMFLTSGKLAPFVETFMSLMAYLADRIDKDQQ